MSRTRSITTLALCSVLAACGGGGGSSSSPHDMQGTTPGPDGGDGSTGGPDGGIVVRPGSVPPTPKFTACTSGALAFASPQVVSLGAGLMTEHDVVAADLDGDGKLDVAANTVDADGKISVTVMLGKGDGSFGTPRTYAYNTDQTADSIGLAVADFDGDKKYDLVAIGNANGDVYIGVFLNKGDGTFADAVIVEDTAETADYLTQEIRATDLNGDGAIDFVIGGDDGVITVMNHGDGTFAAPVVNATTSGAVAAIALGDFTGDDKPDVAAVDSNNVDVFPNKGDGTFDTSAPKTIATPDFTSDSFAVGDLDGDGKLDLVAWDGSPQLEILLGQGDGTLKMPVTYGPDDSSQGMNYGVLLDLDADGKLDYIATGGPLGEDQIYFGKGDGLGSFAAAQRFDVATDDSSFAPYHFAVGDFNGDGLPDVAALYGVTPDSVTLSLGTCK